LTYFSIPIYHSDSHVIPAETIFDFVVDLMPEIGNNLHNSRWLFL
jgi:hypothetical protein